MVTEKGDKVNTLKNLRQQKGYTLNDVAKKLGCKKQTYWNYEKGIRKIPLDKALLLSSIFGITAKEVYLSLQSNQNVNNITAE
jgi:transcriptional regulator with XRE-family HTH domain